MVGSDRLTASDIVTLTLTRDQSSSAECGATGGRGKVSRGGGVVG